MTDAHYQGTHPTAPITTRIRTRIRACMPSRSSRPPRGCWLCWPPAASNCSGPAPLQRWLHELINRFQLDPDHGALAWLSQHDQSRLGASRRGHRSGLRGAALCRSVGTVARSQPGPRGWAASVRPSTCRSTSTHCIQHPGWLSVSGAGREPDGGLGAGARPVQAPPLIRRRRSPARRPHTSRMPRRDDGHRSGQRHCLYCPARHAMPE